MRFLFCLLLLIGILPLIFSSSSNSAIEKYGGGYLNDDEAAPWVPEGHPFRSHPYWFGSRDKQKEIMTPLVVAEAPHWTYERSNEEHGPYVWDKIDKRCGGTKQSPINFEPTNIKKDRSLGRIQENWRNLQNGVISHNGHTIIYNVNPSWTTDKQYHILKGGSLIKGSIYKLLQFHIHIGSEHTFSWAQYPLELHAVHINNDQNKAVEGNPEELAVVAFTFRETRKDNPALEPFVSAAERLMTARKSNPSATITIPSFNLTALIPQKNNYFSYPGSLTTPNCRESVSWHVYEEQVPIGGRQLEKLIAAQGFSNNYRNTQSYNGRVIKGYRP